MENAREAQPGLGVSVLPGRLVFGWAVLTELSARPSGRRHQSQPLIALPVMLRAASVGDAMTRSPMRIPPSTTRAVTAEPFLCWCCSTVPISRAPLAISASSSGDDLGIRSSSSTVPDTARGRRQVLVLARAIHPHPSHVTNISSPSASVTLTATVPEGPFHSYVPETRSSRRSGTSARTTLKV